MPNKIQADYDALANAVKQFAQTADHIQQLGQQVSRAVEGLHSGGWVGLGAERFFQEMEQLVFPGVNRLSSSLQDASQATQRIFDTFQQAEEEAGRLFQGDGSGSADGGGGPGFVSSLFGRSETNLTPGKGVNAADYHNGVDGWNVVPGSTGPFVVQDGGTCWLYGPMNAAIAGGYPVTQAQADKIAGDYSHWNPFWGGQQDSILKDLGVNFSRHNFSEWGQGPLWTPGFNASAAEKFLIDNVKAGKPVMVDTASDNTFGVAGGAHSYTVLGVKTDASGKLTSVLVSTNWKGSPNYEIPADTFMKDWGDRNGSSILIEPPAKK